MTLGINRTLNSLKVECKIVRRRTQGAALGNPYIFRLIRDAPGAEEGGGSVARPG